ncbi:MAG: bifunctional methylenetetrahydrofolate dehydrogenase/methenyltetrahydrofolate cyclohydrolase, partial [Geminicoccaceae bacterium]|nr:bifunctional methylenetetrahydrofolate dehydrogenase/methenyltetrahydrofolate cyclohydrolase [Geminicoccaceae bacterium]
MTARIIDGKAEAGALRARIKDEVAAFQAQHGLLPGLKVIIVGDDPASRTYTRTKTRNAEEVGMNGELIELPSDTTSERLLAEIARLNEDPATHGILVQLPLPPQIDEAAVLIAVRPDKDVDGFHPMNVGRLFSAGRAIPEHLLVPCTPYGCLHLLRRTLDAAALAKAHAVVVGRSNIVG